MGLELELESQKARVERPKYKESRTGQSGLGGDRPIDAKTWADKHDDSLL